jgi:hypothetical protein
MSDVNVEELVKVYVALRDRKHQVKTEADAQIAEIDRDMQLITGHLLEVCRDLGADNIRTGAGTVIRAVKSKFWTSDWQSMYRFIEEHNMFDLLERRIHQTNMKQFLEANPELMPEGLNIEKEYNITIRRK